MVGHGDGDEEEDEEQQERDEARGEGVFGWPSRTKGASAMTIIPLLFSFSFCFKLFNNKHR